MMRLFLIYLLSSTNVSFSRNYCRTRTNDPVRSICQGRNEWLPKNRVRNLRYHRFECLAGVDHHLRRPQIFDFSHWSALLDQGVSGQEDAYNYRRSLSEIGWAGSVPYHVEEVWSWEECVFETNGQVCGYSTHCSGSGESRYCYTVPNACWHDKVRIDSFVCSQEEMTYEVAFHRPEEQEWNPSVIGYHDAIPNKYDLLPGEIEDIQVFNQKKRLPTLHPYIAIGDAWNEYKPHLSGSALGATCQQNTNYHLDVTIETLYRYQKKRTPNLFQLPLREDGSPMDAIVWQSGETRQGKTIEKAIPEKIRLTDPSSAMINLLARQSRRVQERETQKRRIDDHQGTKQQRQFEIDYQGYWRKTKVKVELFRDNDVFWNDVWSQPMYTQDVDAIKATAYSLSQDQQLMFSDLWEIDLQGRTRQDNLFRHNNFWSKLTNSNATRHLMPNRNYILQISVYQEGVPFYRQSCTISPGWDCHPLIPPPFHRAERHYFSQPLQIKFRTHKEIDNRDLLEKLSDELNLVEKFLFWFHERKRRDKV